MASVSGGRGRRRMMGEINVVPYIDVMLVLLVIFMVTAPLMTQGVKVDLPKAGAKPLPDPKDPLVVSIDRNGRVYANIGDATAKPLDPQALADKISLVVRNDPDAQVLLKADTAVPYGEVMKTMVLLQRVGATKVGFLTDPAVEKARL